MKKNCNLSAHIDTNSKANDFFFIYTDCRSLECLIKHLEKYRQNPLDENELFNISFISHAFTYLTHKWVTEEMFIPPQRMTDLIVSMLPEFTVEVSGV